MSNYSQITFFTPKDSLPAGNAAKIIYGATIDPELAAISTAITSKYDANTTSVPNASLTFGGNLVFQPTTGVALNVVGAANSNPLTITSANSATDANSEIYVSRAGSTINNVAEGPNLSLNDSSAGAATIFQNSGGQTEFWQYNGSWLQRMVMTGSGTLTAYGVGAGAQVELTPDAASFNCAVTGPWSGSGFTMKWRRIGDHIKLYVDVTISGTSTATAAMTVTGLPSAVIPAATRTCLCGSIENESIASTIALVTVTSSGTMAIQPLVVSGINVIGTSFQNSGIAAIQAGWNISYNR